MKATVNEITSLEAQFRSRFAGNSQGNDRAALQREVEYVRKKYERCRLPDPERLS